MKLWSIQGNSQKLDGGAMFGNAPKAMWQHWAAPDDGNRIALACRALLARPLAGKTVLFETGVGAFFAPALRERYGIQEERHVLLDSLREAGVAHPEIDVVVLSHLHFDHAGGLLAPWRKGAAPELLFPNARFLVGAAHWQRALQPHPRDRASFIPELPGLLEASGRLELVDGHYSRTLGEAVRFRFSDGHTPGLMLAEIVGAQQADGQAHGGVAFCADLIPGRSWVHVPITMGYDRNAELLIDEKRAFLEDALARNVHLFFTHDPDCALAQLARDGKGRFVTTHALPALQARVLAAGIPAGG
ncbi:MBL fold metallo-hydrolase [Xanthomonas translucens]|uniref:MBL fold metallo-hydrolase n=1 Tax=Xanthomonas campestris pv. translucens TaxID=343 RepID=UPI00071E94E1|nr:MBL fold metallo-hydrolase [Xanthomonas translucens]KTF39923.1 metallo-beta-lactamase [Xanthomonas translucens pv. translucens]KWV11054.1 MBL fold metallo-hydrolase [Xanthomonas translucens]MCS3359219.1 MBL fold metallo-hydrolase [Xanthomonas translucens pv. translucens]MCS3373162.1 MBL fold metallo-hydrolase [Xanthomonas translucens pv. translucens]MCT8273251.1 MBL fold metallo-hydrolase [Xanthomonas translucens pv. translucens]